MDDLATMINNRFDGLQKDIKDLHTELALTRAELKMVKTKVSKNETEIVRLKHANAKLQSQVNDLDLRARKNNLILFGVKETSIKSDRDFVNELCNSKLDVDIVETDINNVVRLKNRDPDKTAPLIITFHSISKRDIVLKSATKLKGTNYFISADLPPEIHKIEL
jgi:chromosome segregation ATPase